MLTIPNVFIQYQQVHGNMLELETIRNNFISCLLTELCDLSFNNNIYTVIYIICFFSLHKNINVRFVALSLFYGHEWASHTSWFDRDTPGFRVQSQCPTRLPKCPIGAFGS